MARLFLQILLAAASLVAGQSTTCPNEVAIYNQQDRTMSTISSEYSLYRKQTRPCTNICYRLVPSPCAEGRCEEGSKGIVLEFGQPTRTKPAASPSGTELPGWHAPRHCQCWSKYRHPSGWSPACHRIDDCQLHDTICRHRQLPDATQCTACISPGRRGPGDARLCIRSHTFSGW